MKKKETTYTDARKKAIYKYSESRDRIYLSVPKGKKAVYEKAASASGKSLNQFIIDTLDKEIKEEP